jgi:hypothetical protein
LERVTFFVQTNRFAAANRDWMSEKHLPPADQGMCFFLTSPFIEAGGLKQTTQKRPRAAYDV